MNMPIQASQSEYIASKLIGGERQEYYPRDAHNIAPDTQRTIRRGMKYIYHHLSEYYN